MQWKKFKQLILNKLNLNKQKDELNNNKRYKLFNKIYII